MLKGHIEDHEKNAFKIFLFKQIIFRTISHGKKLQKLSISLLTTQPQPRVNQKGLVHVLNTIAIHFR